MTKQDILGIGISVVVTTIVWLSGYVTGLDKGIKTSKEYIFEKVAKEAVKTAGEMLDIAKKLQKEKYDLQKENDLLKEQLSQEQNQKQ